MQISDYISAAALIVSVGVAIYCYRGNSKQALKLFYTQKKTELLQKIDNEVFTLMNQERVMAEIVLIYKSNKAFRSFLSKDSENDLLKRFDKTIEKQERMIKENREYIKKRNNTRELVRKIDINRNSALIDESLQLVNLQLLNLDFLAGGLESLKKDAQDITNEYIKFKEKRHNDEKCD
jgi:hypothetical protein